jgi:outer membrane receptor protein involved in Fe transport
VFFHTLSGRALNFEFVDEVQVRTGGYAAEYGKATGGAINVITRSGGNDYHGDVFGYYFSDALQSAPTDEVDDHRQAYGGSHTVDAFTKADLGFDLGGYLLKDRLWYFAAYDFVANDEDWQAAKDFSGYGGPSEGAVYVQEREQHLWSGKLTWRPADSHSLIASAFGDPATTTGPLTELNGEESTFLGTQDVGGDTAVLRWEGVLGTSLVVDAQVSRLRRSVVYSSPATGEPQITEYTTPQFATTGVPFKTGGFGAYSDRKDARDAGRADATLFIGDLAGDHEVKAGAEIERADIVQNIHYSGGQNVQKHCTIGYLTADGCPEEWAQYWHGFLLTGHPPGGALDPDFASYVTDTQTRAPESRNQAAYLQDSWRVLPSLTLNLGVRWERQRFYDYHGALKLELDDEWAPRVGFAWDVRSDGAAKLYGSWGRFYESAPLMLTLTFNDSVTAENDNRSPSSIECDTEIRDVDPWYGWCEVGSASPTPVDPAGVEGGYLDDAVLGGELSVARDLVAGAKLVYRRLGRIVEDAYGPEGFYMGNPGHGMLQTAPDLLTRTWMLPLPQPKRTFRGVELTARKRFSDNWQLMASYLWSKLEGNFDGSYYPDFSQYMPNASAAFDWGDFAVHNDGYLANDRRHQAKISVAYAFPFGLTAGASAFYRSGTPLSALGWNWYGNILCLSQRGAWGRTDSEYEVDLHLAYPIKVGGVQVNLLLDAFNLLDRQGETHRDQAYNHDWTLDVIDYETGEELPPLAPGTACASAGPPEYAASCNAGFNTTDAWQDPRSIRLGVRVTF